MTVTANDSCTLFCFDREHGDDPHVVRIAVDRDDAQRILAQGDRDLIKSRDVVYRHENALWSCLERPA